MDKNSPTKENKSDTLINSQKIELLKYNISRFDHYYASVNFKSSFLVVGNITILGFLIKSAYSTTTTRKDAKIREK